MAVARTQTLDQRTAIFNGLVGRNRLVAGLRIAVPLAGIVAFLLLIGQIWLAGMARQYGVSGMRIDRGNLVVETPQYAGIGADGSRYVANAKEARTPLDQPSIIDMTTATFDFTKPGGAAYHGAGDTATLDTHTQHLTVPGITHVHSDDGMFGTLNEVHADFHANTVNADGAVDLTFQDGTNLKAGNMVYQGKLQLWSFAGGVTMVVPDLPKGPLARFHLWSSPWADWIAEP
jgi:hypothetical protein